MAGGELTVVGGDFIMASASEVGLGAQQLLLGVEHVEQGVHTGGLVAARTDAGDGDKKIQ